MKPMPNAEHARRAAVATYANSRLAGASATLSYWRACDAAKAHGSRHRRRRHP